MKKIQMSEQLLVHKIQFLYDVETQIEKALPKMIKKATDENLKAGLSTHLEETTTQRERLEKIFELLDENPKKAKSETIRALVLDSESALELIDDPTLMDMAIAGSARQVEHYEMALYLCAITDAEALGLDNVVQLLEETFQEEEATDEKLADMTEEIVTTTE